MYIFEEEKNIPSTYLYKDILTFSHLSTHFEWNSWLHGKIRKVCLTSKSHMQTTHVVWSFSEPSPVYLKNKKFKILLRFF